MSIPEPPSLEVALRVQRAAIAAIADTTSRFSDEDWARQTPCDAWTALDLAGHVITAAVMWHEALDDAQAGVGTARWRWNDLSRHNDEYLAALPEASGPERIKEFVDRANHWCDRVAHTDPELPFPIAVQEICLTPITVRLFPWLAGGEFHLHAWDFAQTIGQDYNNPHAESILDARQALFGTARTEGDPWEQILTQSRN